MAVRAVFFDIGETLVDETRIWEERADAAGVPRFTFLGLLGGLAALGQHHRRVFEILGVQHDVRAGDYSVDDLYPDALPCLASLGREGYRIGLAGNQPESVEPFLASCGVRVDVIASSARWGVEKPSPEFFVRVVREAGCEPREVAYVGDRVDNDVVPAVEAGLVSVFVRRGPWGYIHAEWPDAARAHARIDSLAELPEILRGL